MAGTWMDKFMEDTKKRYLQISMGINKTLSSAISTQLFCRASYVTNAIMRYQNIVSNDYNNKIT